MESMLCVNTLFSGNIAKNNNGGAFCAEKSVTIKSCIFIDNKAMRNNAGAFSAKGSIICYNSIFSGNYAREVEHSTVYLLSNVTIVPLITIKLLLVNHSTV